MVCEARAGFIISSTGIATDDTTKDYFGALVRGCELAAFYSFENEEKIFPGVHNQFKFAIDGGSPTNRCASEQRRSGCSSARQVAVLTDGSSRRHFELAQPDFATLNPNTHTCPTFRSRRDADLNLALYSRTGVLWREDDAAGNPWGLRFMTMLHMANDSGVFSHANWNWRPTG